MAPLMIKQKVLQEIELLPEDKLVDIYNFIHHLRLGVETAESKPAKSIMSFAGSWNDMPEDVFQAMSLDIQQRRNQSFSRRRGNEGITRKAQTTHFPAQHSHQTPAQPDHYLTACVTPPPTHPDNQS